MLKKWFSPHIAVKQSIDNLPSGICFFDKNGMLILCNRKMYNIFFELANTDLRYLKQLESIIKADEYFELGDGTIWQFAKSEIVSNNDEKFTQYLASDITELYKKHQLLEQENARLTKMYERQKVLFDNINDIVRDEETLALKIKIHDDLGRTIITMKNCLENDSTLEEIQALSKSVKRSFDLLVKTTDYDYSYTLDSAIQSANQIGVEVKIDGNINNQDFERILPLAIRECSTNCIRHAKGNTLFVTINEDYLSITNNGKPPRRAVTEGGGLQNMRKICIRNNLNMTVFSDKRFEIIIERNQV